MRRRRRDDRSPDTQRIEEAYGEGYHEKMQGPEAGKGLQRLGPPGQAPDLTPARLAPVQRQVQGYQADLQGQQQQKAQEMRQMQATILQRQQEFQQERAMRAQEQRQRYQAAAQSMQPAGMSGLRSGPPPLGAFYGP
jgi:hypothetical protein